MIRINLFLFYFIICLLLSGFKIPSSTSSPLTTEVRKGPSGLSDYTIIYKNKGKIGFMTTRPDVKDTTILLSIAGAFTRLTDYGIDGLNICNGKTGNKDRMNHTLGGAIKIVDGECSFFATNKGSRLTDSLIASLEQKKASLFQQILMIDKGLVAHFKDTLLFVRRGVVQFAKGRTAIIESTKPITLKTFASDLHSFGVQELLYTDMGSWDEGWYRNPLTGALMPLGYDHSRTNKQSNWVIFRK
ncbi:MAG: hypothetical protein ACHQRM_00550 [Bacteroidia bacterium]